MSRQRLVHSRSDRVFAALSFLLLLGILALTTWLAVLSRNQEHKHSHKVSDAALAHESKNELGAGTDMFWELHDRHFPTHYLQDGRVICSEEQATEELEKLGMKIER